MNNWNEVEIQDVVKGIFDGPHATPAPATSGPIFLGIKNVKETGGLNLSEIRYISEEDFPKWIKRVTPQEGDIVFTYEASLNLYAIIPKNFRGCLGRRMALIRPDNSKINYKYLYYYFFSPMWRDVISENTLSGATVDRIPLTKFPRFKILLPERSVQDRIATRLSAIDELISNNQRRIELLISVAMATYKNSFNNPGADEENYKDSNDLDVIKLGDVLNISRGRIITRETVLPGNVPVVAGGLLPAYSHNKWNAMGPVVTISASGANSGYINLYHVNIWASDCSYFSRQESKFLYYYYLLLISRQDEVYSLQRGSAQPHVNPTDLMRLEIFKYDDAVIEKFENKITPVFELINSLELQNTNLRALAKLLSQRFFSGEI